MANAELTSSQIKRAQTIFNKLRHDFVQWKIPIGKVYPELGFVKMSSCYAVTYLETDGFKVNVSSLLFDEYGNGMDAPADALRSILAHELCHTIDGAFNHGKTWKFWVKKLNEEHGCRINPCPYSKRSTDLY